MRRLVTLGAVVALFAGLPSSTHAAETDFRFGGYIKFDANNSYYRNGDVPAESPLRDFHLPGAIPVGGTEKNFDVDYHVKESRFNFGTLTKFDDGWQIRGFLELDFLLSPAGDERVSNSFNPRLRHFYFETGNWLFGQTWTTLQIVTIPDNLDFAGAAEGIVFGRQPQVRYTNGPWQIALENPETVVNPFQGTERIETESSGLPDLIGRRNFKGRWGHLGLSAIARQLHYNDPDADIDSRELGFGASFGGELKVGKRDDFRFQLTGGRGLGRYVALNFVNAAVLDSTGGEMKTIGEVLGYVAYRHFWNRRLRSTVDISLFAADNPDGFSAGGLNQSAQSYSVNLLYSPTQKITLGAELMHGRRELESGVDGSFDRLQLSAIYFFGFTTAGKPD